jgi:hypothetical protein
VTSRAVTAVVAKPGVKGIGPMSGLLDEADALVAMRGFLA